MDLIKCPKCGELYSPSYRRCPFCEEDSGKRVHRGGRRVSDHGHTLGVRGPLIGIVLLVLLIVIWCLFGQQLLDHFRPAQEPPVEDVTPAPDQPTEPEEPHEGDAPVIDETAPEQPAEPVDVSNVKISNSDFTLKPGETTRLTLDPAVEGVAWRSENESVATVDGDGTVTGVGGGNTKVIASYGEHTWESTVRVKGAAATPATQPSDSKPLPLGSGDITLGVGEKHTFNVAGATSVTWSIGDSTVATVSGNGTVTGVTAGKNTTVTAKADGKTYQCTIRVSAKK